MDCVFSIVPQDCTFYNLHHIMEGILNLSFRLLHHEILVEDPERYIYS